MIKMVHHTAFVTSTEAELFAIRCSINQVYSIENIFKIIIVTDSIHTARKIFDDKSNPYQIHLTIVLHKLQYFFSIGQENSVEFWECPSCLKWRLHKLVDKKSKSFNPLSSLPSKISWDFCRKTDSDNIINLWKITFQALNGKGKNFLDLADINNNIIEPSYIKGGLWLQAFGSSNFLCARTTRAITNHTLTGKYWLQFFPKEDFQVSVRSILYRDKKAYSVWIYKT